MPKPLVSSGKKRFSAGYVDDVRMAGENNLAPPSINCDITKTGEAVYRKGYIPMAFDLNNAGKSPRPFHVARYNVTFFAINGKVLFVNHNNSDAVVDTGVSLTETDGKKTRFAEYAGDIYFINPTDGLWQIHMGLLNDSAANAGDSSITVDQDLAGRLNAFSHTTGSLRIANTTPFAESYTAAATSGAITLTNTLDANVADNTIVYKVTDISSGKPKGSGLTFWKERMIIWGVQSDTGVNSATNLVYMSSFASIAGSDGTALANVIDFTVSNTAALEMVGKNGIVTNVLSTRDYLYVFTQNETYFCSVADVDTTTGGCPPQLLSNKYGCVNEDCASDLGNGLAVFMTNNKRIIGIRISSQTGAPVVFPDESFDSPISNTVALLDSDQSDSFFFYAPNDHRAYMHCNVDGSRVVFKFNTEIQKMEPPTTGWTFGGMYVKAGVTYATLLTDDDVFQLNEGYQDNGSDYEKVIATALVEDEDGRTTLRLNSVGVSGRASELASITAESYVASGTPQQKTFSAPSGASVGSLGNVVLGTVTLGNDGAEDMVEYDKLFAIYPSYGSNYQLVMRSTGAFTVSSYSVYGSPLRKPLLTLS